MSQRYDVFISYGRSESKWFAKRLVDNLSQICQNVWFDQNDIPVGVDFQNQIRDGIERTDNFIFIISPHSIESEYCRIEIEHAVKLNKRIIPILHIEPPKEDLQKMHPAIQKINWIYLREQKEETLPQEQWKSIEDFEKSFDGLKNLLHQQKEYVKLHTQFLLRAIDWDKHKHSVKYLLTGKERKEAVNWMLKEFKDEQKPCEPTDLHCQFITESKLYAENQLGDVYLCYDPSDIETRHIIFEQLVKKCITISENVEMNLNIEMQSSKMASSELAENFSYYVLPKIEQAENFIFFISPRSVVSDYCLEQYSHAIIFNKRIIPVLVEDTDSSLIFEELRGLSYYDFRNQNKANFSTEIDKLQKELDTDKDYFELHHVLLARARMWTKQKKNPSFLLKGFELQNAKEWLSSGENKKYQPTGLHQSFIDESISKLGLTNSDVYISFPPTDDDFANRLNIFLQENGKLTWFDHAFIPKNINYSDEVLKGIEESNNFIFIITPETVTNEQNIFELESAIKLHKRVLPILWRETAKETYPEHLKKTDLIDFLHNEFQVSLSELIRYMDVDREHVQNHTKWTIWAKEWNANGRADDLLLRGKELAVAETWLQEAIQSTKYPLPTPLQEEFIGMSKAESLRDDRRKNRAKVLLQILLVFAVIALFIALFFIRKANQSRHEAIVQKEKAEKASQAASDALNNVQRTNIQNLNLLDSIQRKEGALQKALGQAKQSQNFAEQKRIEAELAQVQAEKDRIQAEIKSKEAKALFLASVAMNTIRQSPSKALRIAQYAYAYAPYPINFVYQSLTSAYYAAILNKSSSFKTSFEGHTKAVQTVCYSPDSSQLLTASLDGTAKLWDLQGNVVETFNHTGAVNQAIFGADETKIFTASSDNTVKLWDLNSSDIKTFQHDGAVNTVVYSPESNLLLTASDDSTARLWDLNIGSAYIFHHSAPVKSATFPFDHSRVLTITNDDSVRIWLLNGKVFHTYTGQNGKITQGIFSPDGKKILTASDNGSVFLRGLITGKLLDSTYHRGAVNSIAFSTDGKFILTASNDKTVKLWNVSLKIRKTFLKADIAVLSANFTADGMKIFVTFADGSASMYDLQGIKLVTLHGHGTMPVSQAIMNFDGTEVITAGKDGTIKLWDLKIHPSKTLTDNTSPVINGVINSDGSKVIILSGNAATLWNVEPLKKIVTFNHTAQITSINFLNNETNVLTTSKDKTAIIWDLNGAKIKSLDNYNIPISKAVISPDQKYILTIGLDKTAILWHSDGNFASKLAGHTDTITTACFTFDSKKILTAGNDKTIILWNVDDAKQVRVWQGHQAAINLITMSKTDTMFLTASKDHTVRLWSMKASIKQIFDAHALNVYTACFSPDEKLILTSSADNTAKLWSIDNGKVIANMASHQGNVFSAVFSPDGKQILTASSDKTAKLWDLNGNEIYSFDDHTGSINKAIFSNDGNIILTFSDDKTAKLWHTPNAIYNWLNTDDAKNIPHLSNEELTKLGIEPQQ